jgi:hypothetical protein
MSVILTAAAVVVATVALQLKRKDVLAIFDLVVGHRELVHLQPAHAFSASCAMTIPATWRMSDQRGTVGLVCHVVGEVAVTTDKSHMEEEDGTCDPTDDSGGFSFAAFVFISVLLSFLEEMKRSGTHREQVDFGKKSVKCTLLLTCACL